MVADRKLGLAVGDVTRLGVHDFTVVGVTHGAVDAGGNPLVYLSLSDAQEVLYQEDNRALERSGRPACARFESAGPRAEADRLLPVLAGGTPPSAPCSHASSRTPMSPRFRTHVERWLYLDAYTTDEERELMLRGRLLRMSAVLGLFRALLLVVSIVVISLIVYVLTMEKIRSIATLKLIGAPNRVIVRLILEQSLFLTVASFGVGFALISATTNGSRAPSCYCPATRRSRSSSSSPEASRRAWRGSCTPCALRRRSLSEDEWGRSCGSRYFQGLRRRSARGACPRGHGPHRRRGRAGGAARSERVRKVDAALLHQPHSRADHGEIARLGDDHRDGRTLVDVRRFRRENIGFVFQHQNLIPFLSALDNVALVLSSPAEPRSSRRRAFELLEELGIGHRAQTCRPISPAASSSASRSRAPSSTRPVSFSPTSPPRRSTPSAASRRWSCYDGSLVSAAPRSSP